MRKVEELEQLNTVNTTDSVSYQLKLQSLSFCELLLRPSALRIKQESLSDNEKRQQTRGLLALTRNQYNSFSL